MGPTQEFEPSRSHSRMMNTMSTMGDFSITDSPLSERGTHKRPHRHIGVEPKPVRAIGDAGAAVWLSSCPRITLGPACLAVLSFPPAIEFPAGNTVLSSHRGGHAMRCPLTVTVATFRGSLDSLQ